MASKKKLYIHAPIPNIVTAFDNRPHVKVVILGIEVVGLLVLQKDFYGQMKLSVSIYDFEI